MTSEDIVIIILKYLDMEVVSRWYIDSVVKEKKARRVS